MIRSKLAHSHSLGAGLVLGLLVSQRPLWIFAAGVVVGVALVFAARALRRLVAGARLAGRALERFAGRPGGAHNRKEEGGARELPPATLTEQEREFARIIGLRQGEAAGIRAAARVERREQARRDAMAAAADDHWARERRRSVERAAAS